MNTIPFEEEYPAASSLLIDWCNTAENINLHCKENGVIETYLLQDGLRVKKLDTFKMERNFECGCDSGIKYKKCHGRN